MSDAVRTFSSAGRLMLGRLRALGAGRRSHPEPTPGTAPRGRLFRKYVLLFIGLVSFVLLINSALDFWFSYDENKAALFRIQQEKAGSAARRIEQFVDEIERQLGWTTAPQWAAAPLEQRRLDYARLLRQVPAITELVQLDNTGKEQLKVSRLAMEVVGSETDYSQSPAFIEAKKHRAWFSPVYFRKESEPYMTMAVARTSGNAGVTIAEVNLKLIWDVITGLKIGERGYAYVVDREGRLIAHPDISLVLRNTDLTELPQVAAARTEAPSLPSPAGGGGSGWGQPTDQAVMAAKSIDGKSVLTAHAAIAPLGWTVFVELPLSEALAPLYGSALRTGALLILALGLATLAAMFLARRMTVPIRQLQAGAARIGAGELDRRIEIHTGDELEGLAGEFNRMAADLQKSYADLEKKVEERTAELKEALDQQTATAEVLGVINSSPGDLVPVFDAMLERAVRLCNADQGALFHRDGEVYRPVAHVGFPTEIPLMTTPGNRSVTGQALRRREIVHVADIATDPGYTNYAVPETITAAMARTAIGVPLLREREPIGVFGLARRRVEPFTDKHIALLQNFAAQAVIAIENARLITETREALEQQTATAEVLGVINASPGDLAPVFDAILDKAHTLCDSERGALMTYDGEYYRAVALHGMPETFAELLRQPFRPVGSGPQEPLLQGEPLIHILDAAAHRPTSPIHQAAVDAGVRTVLMVPLRKDDTLLGYITAHRREVRPFTEKQIALLQNFAAQAVIAMENARLLTETREALEQQTATAEVLGVINRSPGDLAPVFDAMLEKATRLCEAPFGILRTWDGERFHFGAVHGDAQFSDWVRQHGPFRPERDDSLLGRILAGERVVSFADALGDEGYRTDPGFRQMAKASGIRSAVTVALHKEDVLLGTITVYRQEVRPFTDKQIALLQNFAAQAVIAMENARLLGELRGRTRDLQESLEFQTAISDVLRVISGSAFDLEPVLHTVVATAIRLCRADQAVIYRNLGGEYRWAAGQSLAPEYERIEREVRIRPGTGTLVGRAALEARTIQILDCQTDPPYEAKEDARIGGIHTLLGVPLLRDGRPIGVISLARRRVEAYTEKEIELVRTFADQAVIAIENARLITELRQRTHDLQESLEYQTATSDVLKVISQSGADLDSVLNTVVETATRICDGVNAIVFRLRGDRLHLAASYGVASEYRDFLLAHPHAINRGTLVGRTAGERRVVHILDVLADPEYTFSESQQRGELRTMLGVPLMREGTLLGVLALNRKRVEPFTDKQIALVTTFADQAVIAIENARLITELRDRTAELGRSIDELTMLREVGQAVSSTLDLRAVLSTILTRSVGLTGADAGAIFRYNRAERGFGLAEEIGWDETLARSVRDLQVAESESAMGEAVARPEPIQLADLTQRASYPLRDVTFAAGFRSALIVPLLGAERILGAIILMRREAGEFPPETVRLMQTLASQSVSAIQNARLFREIADKSEQLALASQHKSQFLANMSHELRTPLNAILGYAELLVDGIYGQLSNRPRGVLERIQNNGKHLLALINDVLDLAKIEAGQLTLTIEDYSMPEVVQSVVSATEPLATSKGLKFTAAVQDELPKAHDDARRVSQVLLNLVGNAIKFTDEGEVEIRASLDEGQFVLTVRDTGPGIADADQDRIFDEFQQIDNTNTRKKGGTGLGLAISKRMVEMQGGTISVDSVLGQGSTFRVVLPVHVDEMVEAA